MENMAKQQTLVWTFPIGLVLGWSVLVITSWATYNICYNKLVEVSMVELSRALAALSKSN